MNIIMLFDRVKNKIKRSYRSYIFRKTVNCPHKNFTLVGDITVINRNIQVGQNVCIYPGCMFFGDGPIVLGNNVDIGQNTVIYASAEGGGVTVGDHTIIAAQCYLIDMDHGTAAKDRIQNQSNSVSPISIGKDCWLGANCTVLKGSQIDDGAIIGAKALVKGKITENAIAVGIPAKEIKKRP